MFQSQNILFCNSFSYFFVTLILSFSSLNLNSIFIFVNFFHISLYSLFSILCIFIEQVDHGESVVLSKENDKREDVNPEVLKPVSEGPVKVDVKSKDRIVIIPAENGESTNLEAIDTSYTYLIVDKEYVHKSN